MVQPISASRKTEGRRVAVAPPLSNPAPAEETSLSGAIANKLEEEILRGRIRPGHRLDERELSQRYGVSRTPVREALQRLAASGLADARGRQGLQVAQLSVADLLDALSVVAQLEALAASQAARRILPEQRNLLAAAHEACEAAVVRGDADGFYDANLAFHDAIVAASHNRVLQDEIRRLSLRTAPYRRAITFQPGRMTGSIPEHAGIMQAILANDGKRAAELMTRHIALLTEGIADFLQFVRASGNRFLFAEAVIDRSHMAGMFTTALLTDLRA
jgi:DNA-binding GntR family transcriptional regulator